MEDIRLAMTIAGSETSGACGMQADLKTFQEYGVYGLVALTSIVTMDPDKNWEHEVCPLDSELISKQLKTILSGKEINAMKTGMLASPEVINIVKDTIISRKLKNVVIDPVMVCKGESTLLNVESADAIRSMLLPIATVTTPNLFEAGVLSGMGKLESVEDMKKAAKAIYELGAKNVVVKGGKALDGDTSVDVFYDGREYKILKAPKIEHPFNNGAGCTFAAAITAGLAKGMGIFESVEKAKGFVYEAIRNGFRFNEFIGQVYHGGYRASGH